MANDDDAIGVVVIVEHADQLTWRRFVDALVFARVRVAGDGEHALQGLAGTCGRRKKYAIRLNPVTLQPCACCFGFGATALRRGYDSQDAKLRAAIEAKPDTEITIDVENLKVSTCCDLEFSVKMPESARDALISGRWDPIQELIDNDAAINERAKALHYV